MRQSTEREMIMDGEAEDALEGCSRKGNSRPSPSGADDGTQDHRAQDQQRDATKIRAMQPCMDSLFGLFLMIINRICIPAPDHPR